VAGSLGADRLAAAAAVVAVARGHLERAVRRVTLERGYDPADFTLVAFGGAGGLHAADLARALGCPRVLIPRAAGVLSALGCLAADVRRDFGVAILEPATPDSSDALEPRFEELERKAARALADDGVAAARRHVTRTLALRYRGQSYEIEVPCTRKTDPVAAFHRAHAERYGYARPEADVEIVAARVAAIGIGHVPTLPDYRPKGEARVRERVAWIGGRRAEVQAWIWDALPIGHRGRGPALVFGDHATALVPPGWEWRVDPHGNVVLEAVE
jgi:N-methylhydantoinase A